VRPLYALALEVIAQKKVNYHAMVFDMDRVVKQEESDELEAAFREALASCLKLKLEQKDYYELPRVSRIALRYGVPQAIDGLLACESSTPAQLLHDLRPFVDLSPEDKEALDALRGSAGAWVWNPARRRFALGTGGE
jgi:hypothetical protein